MYQNKSTKIHWVIHIDWRRLYDAEIVSFRAIWNLLFIKSSVMTLNRMCLVWIISSPYKWCNKPNNILQLHQELSESERYVWGFFHSHKPNYKKSNLSLDKHKSFSMKLIHQCHSINDCKNFKSRIHLNRVLFSFSASYNIHSQRTLYSVHESYS